MAAENLKVRPLEPNKGNLRIPAAHVTYPVLHSKHTRLSRDVKHSLQTVGSLGVVGVLEKDERKAADLIDTFITVLGGTPG